MSCWSICAYSMASISTPHVEGWKPSWPPRHFCSPSYTASSSFLGWAVKLACIEDALSPTPSRTALPLLAAFLLTYFLKSWTLSLWSADQENILHTCFTLTSTLLPGDEQSHSPFTFCIACRVCASSAQEWKGTEERTGIRQYWSYIRLVNPHMNEHTGDMYTVPLLSQLVTNL